MKSIHIIRRFVLASAILMSVASISAQEQQAEYYPIGTTWDEEIHCYFPSTGKFASTYLRNTVCGDTIMADVTYRKVVAEKRVGNDSPVASWDRESDWHWEPYQTYGIRQDGLKVYYRRFEPIIGEQELLRYDFDWSEGKEVPLSLNVLKNKEYTMFEIEDVVTTILSDGESYEGVTSADSEEIVQVKGIGSIGNYGGLFSYYAWGSVPWDGSVMHYHRVLNFSRNGVCIYEWDRDAYIAEQMEKLGIERRQNDPAQEAGKKTYTIDGRTVGYPQPTSLHKGLYIKNGKKFIVR